MLLAPEKLAYLAGIVDGEGCISISKVHRSKTNSTPYDGIRLSARVNISNKSKLLMEELDSTAGHLANYRPYDFNNPLRKGQAYIWEIGKLQNIVEFLESIYPYLIVKKKHCEVLLQFCKSRIGKNHLSNPDRGYTKDEHVLYLQLCNLNNGGGL